MRTSENGKALIRHFEGCRLESYLCPAGVWTVGVGHTGPDVNPGMRITQAQADALLDKDLERFELGVAELVKVRLDQDESDALVSFAFNLGLGNLKSSTLLRKLNSGDFSGACAEFHKWTRADGKVLPGLVKRRAAEAALFAGDNWRTA